MYDNSVPQISLAWLGFGDPHTRVTQYLVRLGRERGSADLIFNVRLRERDIEREKERERERERETDRQTDRQTDR